jgi:putative SOS response-associated peptidase YedK
MHCHFSKPILTLNPPAMTLQAMSGRFCLTASPDQVVRHFSLEGVEPFPPRYNIAPTQPILLIEDAGQWRGRGSNQPDRRAALARWGLIPSWVKDVSVFPLIVSARSEGIAEKASYRGAMRHRRVLIPATGFYEWRRRGKGKPQPFLIRPAHGGLLALAGLKETYLSSDGSEIDTGCLISTEAGGAAADVDERMPLIIEEKYFARWLDCRAIEPSGIFSLLKCPENLDLEAIAISERVNKVANTGPDLHEPCNLNDSIVPAPTKRAKKPGAGPQLKLF